MWIEVTGLQEVMLRMMYVLKWKCGLITNPCHLMTEVLFWNLSLTLDVTTQYHNIDKEKKIFISFLGIEMVIYLQKLESSSSKDTSSQVWLKLAQGFWIWIAISILSFLGKGCGPSFKNTLQSSSMKDTFCQVWLKLAMGFWKLRFLDSVNVFLLFQYYLPLEKGVTLHSKINLSLLHWRILFAKVGWNWPSGFGEEEIFLISSTYFQYFIISHQKRLLPFICTKLNPLQAFPQACIFKVWRRWKCKKK